MQTWASLFLVKHTFYKAQFTAKLRCITIHTEHMNDFLLFLSENKTGFRYIYLLELDG